MLTSEGPQNEPAVGSLRFGIRLLLVGLVVCRGVALLCIMPPFEGWDEYQHVAHVAYYGDSEDPPVVGRAMVPPAVIAAVVQFPQPQHAVAQIGPWGAENYAAYWARKNAQSPKAAVGMPSTATVPLYEAQHGALYYRLMAPLFRAAGGLGDLRRSVACLRVVNLGLTAAAVWGALGTVSRLVRRERVALVIGLLIASQPLFLLTGLRVANDALGVLFSTVAIGGCLTLQQRGLLRQCVLIGLATGLAVLAKAVHFGLVPFVASCWLLVMLRDRVPPLRAGLAAAVLALGFLAVTQAELRSNWTGYGGLTSTQEVLMNHQAGRTVTDLLQAARRANIAERLPHLWVQDNLMVGGWSFLLPQRRLMRYYSLAVIVSLLGWLWLAVPAIRRSSVFFRGPSPVGACLILCLSYSAGLAYHMAHSQLAWGCPTTNAWYASAAFPWFLLVVAAGAMLWPIGWLRPLIPAAVLGTLVAAEATVAGGLMVVTYSGGAAGWDALRRLAELQPPALGTPTLITAWLMTVALLAIALCRCGRAWLAPGENPLSASAVGRPHAFDTRLKRPVFSG